MKKGQIEILSFRNVPTFNTEKNKRNIDTPLVTTEYDLRIQEIQQIRKENNELISRECPLLSRLY
jgi:hypothetical protein